MAPDVGVGEIISFEEQRVLSLLARQRSATRILVKD
jgi:hypothetical protein